MRRSYDEVNEAAGRRSATGPGKPYWYRPLGSTGVKGTGAFEIGAVTGTGGAGIVEDEVETVVVLVAIDGVCAGFLGPYSAAVAAAPAAAPPTATRARVNLDMAGIYWL